MRALLTFLVSAAALFADCTIRPLELGAPVESSLSSSDCKAQDYLPAASTASITALRPLTIQVFTFNIPESGGVLNASLSSSSFPPAVVLINAKNEILSVQTGSTTVPAALLHSLHPGAYALLAVSQSAATGAFTLSTTLESRRDCAPPDWKFGETINAELSATDCRILDVLSPSSTLRPVDLYKITVTEYTVAAFEMASNALRPVLGLINAKTGALINDGSNTNAGLQAQLYTSLPPGDYTLMVTASAGNLGPYVIRSAAEPGRACEEAAIDLPASTRASLSTNSCRVLDILPFSSEFSFARPYKLTVPTKGVVTIRQTSTQFDSYLYLLRDNKAIVAEDDDNAGNGNSQIAVTLNPGTYTILANAYDEGATGAFELTTAFADPPSCPTDTLAPESTITASIATSDCRLHEMILEQNIPALARRYEITLEQPGTLTFDLSTTAFSPALALYDADARFLDLNTAQVRNDTIRGVRTLPAGKYTLFVLSGNLRAGSFTLRYAFQP